MQVLDNKDRINVLMAWSQSRAVQSALALAGVLGLTLLGLGQTPGPPQPQQEAPTVRVTTRLVQLNVIVTDRRGNPAADLKREDFILLDEKEQQSIEVFAVETSRSGEVAEEGLPPNTFSNHLDQKGTQPGSVTVILLDGLNTRFEDQSYARTQIVKFLRQIEPHDRVALYTLGRDLRILHDFTTDAEPLLRTLARDRARVASEVEASEPISSDTGNQQLDEFIDRANQTIADFTMVRRVERTLSAIEAIANHLQVIPGRKNLVWVSSAFPLHIGFDTLQIDDPQRERRTFSREIDRTMRAVNNANLAIYPVDARGLVGAFGPGGSAQSRRPGFATFHQIRGPIDTMQTLAERTGGRAFYNTNDISGSVRRAIDDSRVTYVLGFYPTHNNWNGKFRRLRVKVNRPGTRVRYREGYFALPENTIDENQATDLMQAAAWNPLDATGIGVTVTATPFESSGKSWLRLEARVDGRAIVVRNNGGRWQGEIHFLYIQKLGDGTVTASPVKVMSIDLTPARYERLREQGMPFTRLVELLPDAEMLMFVVRDPTSGTLGTVRIPLKKLTPPATP